MQVGNYLARCRGRVGAVVSGPVLTDERIEAIWSREAGQAEAGKRRIAFARAIAREVAAQAGQVAVPTVLVSDLKEAMRLAEKGHGSKWINYDGNKLAAVLEDLIGAAPLPAKESK